MPRKSSEYIDGIRWSTNQSTYLLTYSHLRISIQGAQVQETPFLHHFWLSQRVVFRMIALHHPTMSMALPLALVNGHLPGEIYQLSPMSQRTVSKIKHGYIPLAINPTRWNIIPCTVRHRLPCHTHTQHTHNTHTHNTHTQHTHTLLPHGMFKIFYCHILMRYPPEWPLQRTAVMSTLDRE